MQFINLNAQYKKLSTQIKDRIDSVLDHGQYILGPEVTEFETAAAQYVGASHCISVASGTDALQISLMAAGVGPGDEVITTPFTFISTVEVIVLVGARPVFVDVEADTANIDPVQIAAKITSKTKAIIPVSLYGQPANMDEINKLSVEHPSIVVIEDAAQSFGSEYKGLKSGNLSTIACTSFFPSKPLGCYGDGGAIFTSSSSFAEKCKRIRVHGQSDRYVHDQIGVGARMDSIQCAVLLAKLPIFDEEVLRRREIGATYNDALDQLNVARIHQREDRTSVFAQYTILVEAREDLAKYLGNLSIPTSIHYPWLASEQKAYCQYGSPAETPVAKKLSRSVLSLPMSAYLEEEEQMKIIDALQGYFQ